MKIYIFKLFICLGVHMLFNSALKFSVLQKNSKSDLKGWQESSPLSHCLTRKGYLTRQEDKVAWLTAFLLAPHSRKRPCQARKSKQQDRAWRTHFGEC